jgi:hypothetical protein
MWRQYPGELASDLSQFHRIRIADWHRGKLSSYELLELADFMDENGRLKTAQRLGDPPDYQKALFQAANELAVLRSTYVQQVNSDEYGSQLFLLPSRLRIMAEKDDVREEMTEGLFAMVDLS